MIFLCKGLFLQMKEGSKKVPPLLGWHQLVGEAHLQHGDSLLHILQYREGRAPLAEDGRKDRKWSLQAGHGNKE